MYKLHFTTLHSSKLSVEDTSSLDFRRCAWMRRTGAWSSSSPTRGPERGPTPHGHHGRREGVSSTIAAYTVFNWHLQWHKHFPSD